MEAEAKSLVKLWILATTSLCYCYYIPSKIPKGLLRLLSLLPVFYLFIVLPFDFTSIHLRGLAAFFLTWLASFKLLLFSLDQGLLSPLPQKVTHFISLACLPIKIKQNDSVVSVRVSQLSDNSDHTKDPQNPSPNANSSINFIPSTPARVLLGFELEPPFNEPYLATSLQDFWGHRWNLMVTNILRPTVYYPIRELSMRLIGPVWAPLPAVIGTFAVSGIVHEIIYYYLTRVNPTWEVTWFFILHGACVAMEMAVKKKVKGRWRLHPAVSGLLTIVFVVVTGLWLFFPQIIRNGVDERVIREYSICIDFLKHKLSALCFFCIE
ncbi:probable long-chain-alcohol O-fatty-acyltransferase 5 [Ricinus communis]|uniref:probable long-chain-alcohol O-fatty-acyltransferase 5 n=1 Tax=Ricinus communis TaxID=3988 RepID=UPI000772D099|nr:probable long-chain-alcohol O-fatty-acyltransferase 5 [Ricinus communis]|eukprot:XP_015580770.1 probable long-chain-alcohol O-fatty-acyltransferase 5 isoform X1 [Ricinus communis]